MITQGQFNRESNARPRPYQGRAPAIEVTEKLQPAVRCGGIVSGEKSLKDNSKRTNYRPKGGQ